MTLNSALRFEDIQVNADYKCFIRNYLVLKRYGELIFSAN
jgi:hypothetical protein